MVSLSRRFWTKVCRGCDQHDHSKNCYIWIGSRSQSGNGYGQLYVGGRLKGAHQVAWFLEMGHWAEDLNLYVLHHCHRKECVRPDHLYLGTKRDNELDLIAEGGHANTNKTHCKNGHLLEGSNLIPNLRNARQCRICHNEAHARYKRREVRPNVAGNPE